MLGLLVNGKPPQGNANCRQLQSYHPWVVKPPIGGGDASRAQGGVELQVVGGMPVQLRLAGRKRVEWEGGNEKNGRKTLRRNTEKL